MVVFNNISVLRAALDECPRPLGFVPTMGALHAGHLSLAERARRECASTAVSIFVNPTQFNDPNDLRTYPRTPQADLGLLEKAGADFVFMPSAEEIYPEPDSRIFDFGSLGEVMEGASRPGHFNGVAQVVSRLLDIVRPDRVYFGEKDFQQIAVVRALKEQTGFAAEIISCPIVRDTDGLALSSRNALLPPEYRSAAPRIYDVLRRSTQLRGMTPPQVREWVVNEVEKEPLLKVIYFEIVDARTLVPVAGWHDECPAQGCIAVQAGPVRLIDNIRYV